MNRQKIKEELIEMASRYKRLDTFDAERLEVLAYEIKNGSNKN